ncbi:hypothetical protein V8C86DRAFT_3024703, partial [Haematococcus lacustris]
MQEILDRLTAFGEFTIVHFSDDILLNKPIEEWPICDTLLSWHSDGFPLAKAEAKSKQMQEILDRLTAFGEFTIVHFSDDILLNKPIEEWPICDTLLSWHSDGFPLAKAEAYAALRRPFCINDLSQQHSLQRRFAVYKTLVAHNIPVPTHIIVQRSGPEDHNVHIYYPSSLGGGVKKLFRKARKSPVVDGKVLRTADGKEMRFPVLLTPQ